MGWAVFVKTGELQEWFCYDVCDVGVLLTFAQRSCTLNVRCDLVYYRVRCITVYVCFLFVARLL